MLPCLAMVWMVSAPRAAWSQSAVWQPQGATTGSIYYNGGNVGIGTATPSLIGGASTPHTLVTQIKGVLVVGGTTQNGNDDALIQFGGFNFAGANNWGGYGAFGTNLAVKSVGNADTFYTPLSHPWLGYAAMVTGASGIQFFTGSGTTTAGGAVMPAARMIVSTTGNVGIGTTSPQYRLAVEGAIGARDIIVTSAPWSDYVFQPGYRLRPLSEVASFIRQHGHLPEIPSEAEVKEKGVSVADVQAKLLAKIEELTLHLIQQEKDNRELRERLVRLEKGVTAEATSAAAR
jgi:hypothetical protein